ncbi:MAG TPA: prolipoprotein diacylglyceryl transferase [Candidatus Limnocylindrales bacterium]|nr:prolipoprotein diacylglyceryl transferase [Candidatus Limnocylindrales bacterium]
MYPELFQIGNLTIYSYGVMIALAILVGAVALYREAPREGITPDLILEAILVTSISGLLGSRLLFVALNWELFQGRWLDILFAQFAGLSFHGALFGGVISLYLWTSWRKVNFLKMADLMAPYLALGYAFGRVGCLLNACCYGKVSGFAWAFPTIASDGSLRHPVQLYASLGAILIFVALKLLRPVRPFVGFIIIMLFALYGVLRFTTEFFRFGETVWLNLTTAQLFSLGLILGSLALLAFIHFAVPAKDRKKDSKKGSAKTNKKSTEKTNKKSTEKTNKKSTEKTNKKPTSKTTKKPATKNDKKSSQKPAKPAKKISEKPTKK